MAPIPKIIKNYKMHKSQNIEVKCENPVFFSFYYTLKNLLAQINKPIKIFKDM